MSRLSLIEKFKILYSDENVNIVTLDGFDNAVIGIEEDDIRLIYSRKKIIKILMKENNWDELEARDFFFYNMSYTGGNNPIICLDDI
jgi:hypothetical protein